ncbi:MAG: hypothetical protein A3J96_02600 [Sulfurimonas sp. RIFOXYC2_FULL_36_7]|nr:MAG: hypothetical protein A3J96_02600 [Sulfurimonas sp. RIFOXYC2_FULL_36_7]
MGLGGSDLWLYSEDTYGNFTQKIINTFNGENQVYAFYVGYVKKFDLNSEFVYLWQDAKGNVCYSFNLLEKEYFTTTATKLSNALSSHFQTNIEVVDNINDTFSRKNTAATKYAQSLAETYKSPDDNLQKLINNVKRTAKLGS